MAVPTHSYRPRHDRNEKLSPAIRDIAWKGQIRLCSRYRRLAAAGKPKVVVTTAIAREMVGHLGDRPYRPADAPGLTRDRFARRFRQP